MFELISEKKPAGDQPKAIDELVAGLEAGERHQTLLGVTGSGKTFTMANVIARTQRPTLVMAHNKTLAAQLASELRELFPRNAVEYFVSYYDYYQPEAYVPTSDTYIGKEAMINEEIDKLRHAATAALLTRKDVIVVASVSCIYGLGAPEEYAKNIIHFRSGMAVDRSELMRKLVTLQFNRTNADLTRGTFRLRGDNWEIMPTDRELVYNFSLADGIVGDIYEYDPVEGFRPGITKTIPEVFIAPARHFITEPEQRLRGIKAIELELAEQLKKFEKEGKLLEAERLERRTRFDLAMIKEVGYAHGIENYSQPLSGRMPGEPPSTLLDYFPENFLTIIDESHVTVPQINGMQAGDKARKQTLVEFGFRLPSAMDNRPLTFDEFEARVGQTIYTSATPGNFEREVSTKIVEQVIRPTGLLDPVITIRPIAGQIDDLIQRATDIVKKGERVLVTTLTKRMAEDLAQFLSEKGVRVAYLHSDVKTLERIKILSDLRKGNFDVLVGVNLLREGLDLPEVSLVAILDADKEGFLRSETALVQTIGRAARNVAGEVVLYADVMTNSLTRAVDETNRRREIQMAYNKEHGITPKTVIRAINDIIPMEAEAALAIELTAVGKSKKDLERLIKQKEREMKQASNDLEFELAAILRDEIRQLKEQGKVASDEPEPEKKGVEHYKSKADVPKAKRGTKRAL